VQIPKNTVTRVSNLYALITQKALGSKHDKYVQ